MIIKQYFVVRNNRQAFRGYPNDFQGFDASLFSISIEIFKQISMGTYVVREDFLARTSDELTVRKGDVIIDGLPSGYGWVQGEYRLSIISNRIFHFPMAILKEKNGGN